MNTADWKDVEALLPAREAFQTEMDGQRTDLYILKNKNNVAAVFTNYGARWVSFIMPDNKGALTDVIVGFDQVMGYKTSEEPYYGATVGRYANRIANGKFSLHGQEYTLATNNAPNHLHGGVKGFQDVVWSAQPVAENSIVFTYLSPDGEEGFPGNLEVKVTYTLTDNNALEASFEATTDKPTVVNLTNHAYFNLNGQGQGAVTDHRLAINANKYTPINATSIPYGRLDAVEGTPFDFRQGKAIGADIEADDEQIQHGGGYDHNFVLNVSGEGLTFAAAAVGDQSGITMEVYTTEPGIQLYTGNFMKGNHQLKGGYKDEKRGAFCLETQHFPDSPNQPHFPSTVLQPGERFSSHTVFQFSIAS